MFLFLVALIYENTEKLLAQIVAERPEQKKRIFWVE